MVDTFLHRGYKERSTIPHMKLFASAKLLREIYQRDGPPQRGSIFGGTRFSSHQIGDLAVTPDKKLTWKKLENRCKSVCTFGCVEELLVRPGT